MNLSSNEFVSSESVIFLPFFFFLWVINTSVRLQLLAVKVKQNIRAFCNFQLHFTPFTKLRQTNIERVIILYNAIYRIFYKFLDEKDVKKKTTDWFRHRGGRVISIALANTKLGTRIEKNVGDVFRGSQQPRSIIPSSIFLSSQRESINHPRANPSATTR